MRRAFFVAALATILVHLALAVAARGLSPDSIEFVLVASWQPAFCQTSDGSGKRECDSLTPDRFDATHFALHGLWPDDLDDSDIFPCYCDKGAPVSCHGSQPSDRVFVSDDIFEELRIVMPGARSNLHRYEWTKHGTCYEDDKSGADNGADPDEYFAEALALMAQLNASPVQALFAGAVGGRLSRGEIEAAFDQAFGAGAGERVAVECNGRGAAAAILELRINLAGDVTPESDLGDLILAAPPATVSTEGESCAGGRVVEVAN